MTAVHRLAPAEYAALSTRATALDRQASALSRHLLQIRALLDHVRKHHPEAGQAADLAGSFRALAALQHLAAEQVGASLRAFEVGVWSAWCLRRIVGGLRDDVPLAVDLAHLGAVAAATAIAAGTDAEVRVPVRDGWLALPRLGRLRVAATGTWGTAALRCESDSLTVAGDGFTAHSPIAARTPQGDAWQPLRTITAGSHTPWKLVLDDVSPYRRVFGYEPCDRLRADEVAHWQEMIDQAWRQLSEQHPAWAVALRRSLTALVPLASWDAAAGVSVSARDALGVIALTAPSDARQLALTLVHELQHNHLNALHNVAPLYRSSPGRRFYSPWRDDPRPLGGVLHGTVAFLGVADYLRRERRLREQVAEVEFAIAVRQIGSGLRTLQGSADALTAAGRKVVASIADVLAELTGEPVNHRWLRLADDLVAEHHLAWRVRNVRVPPRAVDDLVRQWQAGESSNPTTGEPDWRDQPRALLPTVESRRRRLALRRPVPDGTDIATDLAFLDGRYRLAARAYARRVDEDPNDLDAFTGLVISVERLAGHATRLSQTPELLFAALHRTADSHAMTTWLAETEPDVD